VQQPLCPKTLPHLGRQLTHSVRANIPGHACPKADVSGAQSYAKRRNGLIDSAFRNSLHDVWVIALDHHVQRRCLLSNRVQNVRITSTR
jgi:hypothetical protein